jgi:hypothetical protein
MQSMAALRFQPAAKHVSPIIIIAIVLVLVIIIRVG